MAEIVESSLIRRIWDNFAGGLVNHPRAACDGISPMWTRMGEVSVTDPSIISQISIPDNEMLFIYADRPHPGVMAQLSFGEAKQFFGAFTEYGPRSCYYILPKELTWCIAYTQDDIKTGHMILLKGPVPLASDSEE